MLDERMRAAINRLTDNEKECLRRRLLPQTAKEMALELGVSPHAVEKRLKMARTKLGLSSSLQAARLLVQAESHGLVPHAADLAASAEPVQHPSGTGGRRRWWIGGIAMSIMIAAALALTLQGSPPPQDAPTPSSKPFPQSFVPMERRKGTPAEITAFISKSFDMMDKDHSGYLEAAEAPRTTVRAEDGPVREVDPKTAGAMFIARNDFDGDGKVSREEYIRLLRPGFERRGIPVPIRVKH